MVDQLELAVADVVVDRLRHADGHQLQPALAGQRRHFMGGVHRVVAADVEKIADIVRSKHFDHALEVFGLGRLELVAAGADRAGRGRASQQRDFFRRLGRQVQQLFLEHPFDAMPGAVDRADLRPVRGPSRRCRAGCC